MPDAGERGAGVALDREAIARLRRLGGDELAGRMAGLFLELAPRRLEAARTALATGDMDGVRRAAHSLKSSTGNVGAYAMMEAAGRLEEAAEQAAGNEVLRPLFEALTAAWSVTRPELEALAAGWEGSSA